MQIIHIGRGSTDRHPAETVGAKAANLAHMSSLGIPVPPAFVLPVDLCAAIINGDAGAKEFLADGLCEGIEFLENATGRLFGDRRRPLLVSVRSGAARSMPGMLDTVLDVGCTTVAVQGLLRMTGHPRFAWDCRRRFLESYAGVVLGLDRGVLENIRRELVTTESARNGQTLDGEALERLSGRYLQAIEDQNGMVPEHPMEQLTAAAQAVYQSWGSPRAQAYRELQRLNDLRGTAVTIQAMVYGNRGMSSGAGVAFSRDPSTGESRPVIDVLFESQGEDVVSGSRNPEPEEAMVRFVPEAANQLRQYLRQLELEFGDVQDVEFTVEDGQLWILQTRSAKRTPQAALRLAIDFVREGLITPPEALQRLNGLNLNVLVRKRLTDIGEPVGRGTGASAGVAIGRAAFDSASAERLAGAGEPVILIRADTSTADIVGFAVSEGIVTAVGGRTAHAALVARQMDKPCIVGTVQLVIDATGHKARFAETLIKEGDWLSIDGNAGTVYLGQGHVVVEQPEAELAEVERWRQSSPAAS